jgi:hypothetical protein
MTVSAAHERNSNTEIHVADSGRFVCSPTNRSDHLLVKVAMATRRERIDAFLHEGEPPTNQPLEILCEDHVGSTSFHSCVDGRTAFGKRIEAAVIGWRVR